MTPRESFDLGVHGETLAAVVVGAVLATLSGMAANQIESRLHRRERQRDAALFFGELISTLGVLLDNAVRSRAVGDPYGAVTVRILRACRREIDLYDRNRQALYDLRGAALRVKIHAFMVRLAMPLDGVLDASDTLAAVSDDPDPGPRFEALRVARDAGFDFVATLAKEIPRLVAELEGPARHRFDAYAPPPTPGPPAGSEGG